MVRTLMGCQGAAVVGEALRRSLVPSPESEAEPRGLRLSVCLSR